MSLHSIIEEIKEKRKRAPFTVAAVPEREGVFIGLDNEDKPCVFISSQDSRHLPTIRTSHLKVEFSRKYKLALKDTEVREGSYHGILCMSDEQTDREIFVSIIDSMLKSSPLLNTENINLLFHSLVNLFSVKPTQDFVNERRGLWAELFFMTQNGGIAQWADSWHSEPTRVFDFSSKNRRIEIKCTIRPERIHEFSHSQLISLPNQETAIVSYLLQEEDQGKSLRALIEEVRSQLSGSLHLIKLEKAIRRVGMHEPEEEGPRFNESYANQHSAWFKSTEVPRFTTDEPPGVSGTHYKSDLTNATQLSDQEIKSWVSDWVRLDSNESE
jgi:hypothetical protein